MNNPKKPQPRSRVTSFSISRLYNLGNYQNVKYDLCVEVPEGRSVRKAFLATANILRLAAPNSHPCSKSEYEHCKSILSDPNAWHKNIADPKQRKRVIRDMVEHSKAQVKAYDAWVKNRLRALSALDALGGSSKFKDAKYDWEENDW